MKHNELTKFANHLADISEDIILKYFRSDKKNELEKKDLSPVTIADHKIEEIIRKEIEKYYPDHGIIGEEFGEINSNADYKWVIDPIDGTISFSIGKPIFGTLIALTYKNKPIIGIINQPINKERWVGVKGESSYFNDKKIRTKNIKNLEDAVFCSHSPYFFNNSQKKIIDKIAKKTKYQNQGGIIYGGDCYHFALMASGFVDIIMETGLNNYDFTALIPIIESAGGIVTDWEGNELNIYSKGDILACCNKNIHEIILKNI